MKSYYIKTFGCQMNEADSAKIAASLEKKGYQKTEKVDDADLIVVNSCSVRESAENRVFGLLRNLSKMKIENCKLKIVLTGCMVGSTKGKNRRFRFRELKEKTGVVDEYKTIQELLGEDIVSPYQKTKKALVKIMEGCNNFCTYCVVPYARGREDSRPFAEIICEVEALVKHGCKEVTLLGQNVNSYGRDLKQGEKFELLLRTIHDIPGIEKISFLTSNPWDLTDDIIKAMALPKIDRYLHLAVQSGDDEILARMNRKYTTLEFVKLVKKLRKRISDIKVGTDIIVGFPGETRQQFQNTVKLCKKIGFEKAYVSRYSPRPGTAAFHLKDDVPAAEKKRRWQILNKLINV